MQAGLSPAGRIGYAYSAVLELRMTRKCVLEGESLKSFMYRVLSAYIPQNHLFEMSLSNFCLICACN